MISTYEQACDQQNTETQDRRGDSLRRRAYFLAIASFVCNLVSSFAACILFTFHQPASLHQYHN